MGQDVCPSSLEEIDDDVCTVSRCAVVVKPKVLVGPVSLPAVLDCLTEVSHGLQINFFADALPSRNKLVVNHTLGIPENDHHHLANVLVLDWFLGAAFIALEPSRRAAFCCGFITPEPALIPGHNSAEQVTGHPESMCLLVIIEQIRDPLCWSLFQFQFVAQHIVNSPEQKSSFP